MEDTVTLPDRMKLAWFILNESRLTAGPQVKKFEEQWSKWMGCKHSLFVSSGSTANTLLVESWKEYYNIKPGAKVIVPACTWVTNVGPIIQAGLTPVFCDINLKDFSFCETDLARIKREHNDIEALFVTHLLGYPANVEKFRMMFPDAFILEDVCESHGARLKSGKRAGTFDVGGTFSFYFGHHMTTIEGGMVTTNNSHLYDLMRMKRSHGLARESNFHKEYCEKYPDISPQFMFITDGHNFRNNELGAVLGQEQLKRLDTIIAKRNENYGKYYKLLGDYHGLFLMPTHHERISNFSFPFIARQKATKVKLEALLKEYAVEYRPIVSGNLLRQPFLVDYVDREFDNADVLHERGLYIGNSHFVSDYHFEILDEILRQLV